MAIKALLTKIILASLLLTLLWAGISPELGSISTAQVDEMKSIQIAALPNYKIVDGGKMRKKIIGKENLTSGVPQPGELDIATIATALVTSEDPNYPLENAFDSRRGAGGSRWGAAEPHEQTLILAFDTPQTLHRISLEVEELEVSRSQELQLSVSHDGGQTYRELLRQEYNFSPPGTTFEREEWTLNVDNVTHLRLWIKPDKGNKPCRATLTSLVLS
ncbi:MAG: hypothetical protein AB4426_28180 [Xenococcaceae cyanobacterium]